MSRAKVAALLALSPVDMAVWKTKRNQQSYWRHFQHSEWLEFCQKMAGWFAKDAPDEWDTYTAWNKARKLASDIEAEKRRPFPRRPKKR